MDFMRDNDEHKSAPDELSSALQNMGYSEQEITTAYTWFLDQYNGATEQYFSNFPGKHASIRVLTDTERLRISPEAYSFLIKLLNSKVISDEQLEMIIERITFFNAEPMSLDQIKLIASAVVFDDFDGFEDQAAVDLYADQANSVN
jgi:uncharacterized protein Smg (DUF494 family)